MVTPCSPIARYYFIMSKIHTLYTHLMLCETSLANVPMRSVGVNVQNITEGVPDVPRSSPTETSETIIPQNTGTHSQEVSPQIMSYLENQPISEPYSEPLRPNSWKSHLLQKLGKRSSHKPLPEYLPKRWPSPRATTLRRRNTELPSVSQEQDKILSENFWQLLANKVSGDHKG